MSLERQPLYPETPFSQKELRIELQHPANLLSCRQQVHRLEDQTHTNSYTTATPCNDAARASFAAISVTITRSDGHPLRVPYPAHGPTHEHGAGISCEPSPLAIVDIATLTALSSPASLYSVCDRCHRFSDLNSIYQLIYRPFWADTEQQLQAPGRSV